MESAIRPMTHPLKPWLPVVALSILISWASTDAFSTSHTSLIIIPALHWLFPHGVALGLAAGYDGRSNRSGPAVALVPVSFLELRRRSGERCFRNAKLARIYCHNLQPSTGSRGAPTCRGATNPRPLHKVGREQRS